MSDPVRLTQQLLKCPSITPQEAGTFAIIEDFLAARGFSIERFDLRNVANLYARLGDESPHLCFAGHVDVVPPGDLSRWSVSPFSASIQEKKLYGRGVVDMKGAIGAYLSALDIYLKKNPSPKKGSLSLLLTSDEEGPAVHGIRYVVDQLKARGEQIDACLIGEPTNTQKIGDTIKIGRRGSLSVKVTVFGKMGHVAYPQLAKNPIPPLLRYLRSLLETSLDSGMENFDPSHLEITSLEGVNLTTNVIPAEVAARFNIRFNPLHKHDSLLGYLHNKAFQEGLTKEGLSYTLDVQGSGDAFFCDHQALQKLVQDAVHTITGFKPTLSTSGGTSDGRFLKDLCPVIEFGLVNATAHQVDEHSAVEDIYKLSAIYQEIIKGFLG